RRRVPPDPAGGGGALAAAGAGGPGGVPRVAGAAMRVLRRLLVIQSPPVATGGLSAVRAHPGCRKVSTARRAVLSGLLFVLAAHAGLNVALDTVKPEWRGPEFRRRAERPAAANPTRRPPPVARAPRRPPPPIA